MPLFGKKKSTAAKDDVAQVDSSLWKQDTEGQCEMCDTLPPPERSYAMPGNHWPAKTPVPNALPFMKKMAAKDPVASARLFAANGNTITCDVHFWDKAGRLIQRGEFPIGSSGKVNFDKVVLFFHAFLNGSFTDVKKFMDELAAAGSADEFRY